MRNNEVSTKRVVIWLYEIEPYEVPDEAAQRKLRDREAASRVNPRERGAKRLTQSQTSHVPPSSNPLAMSSSVLKSPARSSSGSLLASSPAPLDAESIGAAAE